eukprot:COSAG01_NODE_33_length_35013_cov_86.824144_10_plen_192_part_00
MESKERAKCSEFCARQHDNIYILEVLSMRHCHPYYRKDGVSGLSYGTIEQSSAERMQCQDCRRNLSHFWSACRENVDIDWSDWSDHAAAHIRARTSTDIGRHSHPPISVVHSGTPLIPTPCPTVTAVWSSPQFEPISPDLPRGHATGFTICFLACLSACQPQRRSTACMNTSGARTTAPCRGRRCQPRRCG